MSFNQINTKKTINILLILFLFGYCANAQNADFETIDKEFENPPNAYRIIHYSMNGTLNSSVLDEMENYGIGGIQTRVPLNNYLQSESGWSSTAAYINQAKERDFQVWIHDERGYPSGAAGGLVVQGHPEYEVRGMIRVNKTGSGTGVVTLNLPSGIIFIRANICKVVNGEPDFSTAQEVTISGSKIETTGLEGNWQLSAFGEKILDKDTQAQSTIEQFGQTGHYPSLLNKEACARFIEVTHQNYANHITPIDEKIDVFYTGEPNLMSSYWQYDGSTADYPYIPWEKTLIDSFQSMHGYDLMPHLDALFAGISEQAQTVRMNYYQTIAELVAENYGGQISEWCEENGVRSMGHPLLEEDIICHVFCYGDMLRFLREFHIRGCDLHIGREDNNHWIYWMGKYVGSAAYLDDKDTATIMGLLDPIIGHGRDDLTPEIPILKRTVNMNMLCGLNQFTSYMPYNSANDGYDADEYKKFNEYVGRIGMLLRGSWSEAPVAMYYPIKSFQAQYLASDKPWSQVANDFRERQNVVDDLAKGIIESGIDFNFVTDDVLLKSSVQSGKLKVGSHIYSQLVMPKVEMIPLDVLKKIKEMEGEGIRVHWVEAVPKLGATMEEHSEVKEIAKTILTNNAPISDLRRIRHNEFSISFETSDYQLRMARFRKEGKRIYFIVNDSKDEITLNASSEEVENLKVYNPVDGSTKEVTLPLSETIDGYESLILVETNDESITGINEELKSEEKTFKLLPNPAKSMVDIVVKEQFVGENLEIYNMDGKRMFSQTITNKRFSQDVSGFNAGLYFVRIGGYADVERLLKIN